MLSGAGTCLNQAAIRTNELKQSIVIQLSFAAARAGHVRSDPCDTAPKRLIMLHLR